MAKRENFLIECSTGETRVKHKWNAACREVEAWIRDIAIAENTTYHLMLVHSIKDDSGFYHVLGHREWRGENGKVVRFGITKQ